MKWLEEYAFEVLVWIATVTVIAMIGWVWFA